MRKIITFCMVILTLTNIAHSQTSVSGTISSNTIWNMAGSPYNVVSDVTIASGVILNIEPGVLVEFENGTRLWVDGTLQAIGKEDSLITFTSSQFIPAMGDWKNIYFSPSSQPYNFTSQTGCILQYCDISFGGGPGGGSTLIDHVVSIENASPFIDNCIIHDSFGIICLYQISQNTIISNNKFINNRDPFTSPLFWEPFTFWDNGNDTLFVTCNLFYDNLNITGLSDFNFNGSSVVSNNIIVKNQSYTGIVVLNWHNSDLSKNHIINNTSGSIVNNKGYMTHNTIVNNNLGVLSDVIMNSDSMSNINYNNIYQPPTSFDFYLLKSGVTRQSYNSPIMNAYNNYWGTTDTTAINFRIWDYYDDTTICEVGYLPILNNVDTVAPVTPVENVVKTDLGGGDVEISWDPNPEQDLAGYKIYWGNPTGYSYSNSIDVGNVTTYTLSGMTYSDEFSVTAYDTQATDSLDQCNCHESWYSTASSPQTGEVSKNLKTDFVEIYPNPANEAVYLISETPITRVSIFNLLGQKIDDIYYNRLKEIKIDTKELERGQYILSIEGESGILSKKLIIE